MWNTITKEFKKWQTGRLPQKPLNLTPVFACRVIIGDEKNRRKKKVRSENWYGTLSFDAEQKKPRASWKASMRHRLQRCCATEWNMSSQQEQEQQVLWEMRCGGVSRPSVQGHTEPAGWSSCPGPPAPPPSCLDVSGLPARETHTYYQ